MQIPVTDSGSIPVCPLCGGAIPDLAPATKGNETGADAGMDDSSGAVPLGAAMMLCPTCGRAVEPQQSAAAEKGLPPDPSVSHRESHESIFYQSTAPPAPTPSAAVAMGEAPMHMGQELDGTIGFPLAASPARAATRRRIPISIWLLVFFIPYSIASTIGLWMLYQQLQQERAKQNRNTGPEPEADQAPATAESARLGETKPVGGLEVTPLRVEWQRNLRQEFPPVAEDEGIKALVLHLRIKNVSENILRPLHPSFNRRHESALTYLAIGKARYYGPAQNPAKERFAGQWFDELKPGEEMEALVFAAASAGGQPLAADWNELSEQKACKWNVALLAAADGEPFGKRALQAVWILPVTFVKQDVEDN